MVTSAAMYLGLGMRHGDQSTANDSLVLISTGFPVPDVLTFFHENVSPEGLSQNNVQVAIIMIP